MPSPIYGMPSGVQKTGMNIQADEKIEKYQALISSRRNFESYWQTLHDYFYIEAQNINRTYYAGNELDTTYLWDSTTLEASDVLASGFMNYLTPPTTKWFRLRAKNPNLSEDKEVSDFLEYTAEEIFHALNRSNFYGQIFPAYKSSGVYGTSILLEEEDIDDDIRFSNLPIKQTCIVEDARGKVIEYYIEFEYTAIQARNKFGEEKLTKEMQEELKSRNPNKKHKFLLVIAERHRRDINKEDKLNMPIEALWIDVSGKKVIDEGGYNEMPCMTHRFDKRPFIEWGFSPAMKCLPFARMLNAIAKTNLRMMMKLTDPPLAVPSNAFIMPFNANPRSTNYYLPKRLPGGGKDIFPFGNYGEPKVGMAAVDAYTLKVKNLMYNDVFLAFDQITKQMNNPEVMERINEKMTLLGPAVGRWTSEILDPIIKRTIGILYRKGKLPPIPEQLAENPQYEIDYVSQLAQSQKRSELNSMITALEVTGKLAEFSPDVLDKIDTDRVVDETWSITGAPIRVLRDDEDIDAIRESRIKAAQQQQQIQQIADGAQTVKTASEADKNIAESKAVK